MKIVAKQRSRILYTPWIHHGSGWHGPLDDHVPSCSSTNRCSMVFHFHEMIPERSGECKCQPAQVACTPGSNHFSVSSGVLIVRCGASNCSSKGVGRHHIAPIPNERAIRCAARAGFCNKPSIDGSAHASHQANWVTEVPKTSRVAALWRTIRDLRGLRYLSCDNPRFSVGSGEEGGLLPATPKGLT